MSCIAERRDQQLRFKYVPQTKLVTMESIPDGDLVQRVSALISAEGWKGQSQQGGTDATAAGKSTTSTTA